MTYKPSRIIYWLAINGLFATLGYLGLWRNIEGARNAFLFIVWLCVVCCVLCLAPESHKTAYERGPSVPHAINAIFDIAVTLALAWFGYGITAGFYVLGAMAQFHIYTEKPTEV